MLPCLIINKKKTFILTNKQTTTSNKIFYFFSFEFKNHFQKILSSFYHLFAFCFDLMCRKKRSTMKSSMDRKLLLLLLLENSEKEYFFFAIKKRIKYLVNFLQPKEKNSMTRRSGTTAEKTLQNNKSLSLFFKCLFKCFGYII